MESNILFFKEFIIGAKLFLYGTIKAFPQTIIRKTDTDNTFHPIPVLQQH